MHETMGQIIKRLRKERGLTQESLAERLGVTFQAVSKWETDAGMPDVSQIVPLANAFGVRTRRPVRLGGSGRGRGSAGNHPKRVSAYRRPGRPGRAAALLSGAAGGAEALSLSAGAAFAGAGGRRIAGLSRKRVL